MLQKEYHFYKSGLNNSIFPEQHFDKLRFSFLMFALFSENHRLSWHWSLSSILGDTPVKHITASACMGVTRAGRSPVSPSTSIAPKQKKQACFIHSFYSMITAS